jgi:TPR repeat
MFAYQSLRALAVAAFVAWAGSAPASAAVPAPAHRRAVAANTQGWRYFKAGQLPRAAMRFRDALAIDPDYVLAHYNLACVSSRLREAAVALDELRWLAASSDPLAKAKLDKSLSDPDLDFVSVLPAVRELLQLPAPPTSPSLAWLSERHGVWSAEQPTADCAERSYRLAFATDGTLQLTVREACSGQAVRARVFDGSVSGDGDPRVAVPGWAQWPDGVRLAFVACPGLGEAPASCFTLASDASELGPFHRGLPGMSPMRARRDMATAR